MDELTKDFLQESGEKLDRLDQDIVKLEKEPDMMPGSIAGERGTAVIS